MADLPRLNGVIRALEAGQHAFTCFAPADVDSAIAMSAVEVRRRRVRDGAQSVGRRARCATACNTCSTARRSRRPARRAAGDADGAHPGQRRRDGAVARQAGARHRLLRHRVAAHLDRGRGLQRGRRLPLSAPEDRADTTSRPASAATGRPRAVRYWGLTQQEYYKKADVWPLNPNGEIFVHPADRGHARHREPRRHAEERAGHRRHPDRRRRSRRRSSAIRASTSIQVVLEWMKRVVDTCKKHNVVVGHPHVEAGNASASSRKATAS